MSSRIHTPELARVPVDDVGDIVPRVINQLALQAMVDAVVRGLEQVDATLMRRVLLTHPLYAVSGTAA